MESNIKSPLTGNSASRVGSIAVSDLCDAYLKHHKIDVSPWLLQTDAIDIYRCEDTGLEFYNPAPAGAPEFYSALYGAADANWGYQSNKWEHEFAAMQLNGAQTLLDVGCGAGTFLLRVRTAGMTAIDGLETNPYGREKAVSQGLSVHDETIEAHAETKPDHYDVVTAFQVLEHVQQPLEFLAACVAALKPGGRLIIGVPNNESFIRCAGLLPLNSPPHHLTRWSRQPLESLETLLPIEVMRLEYEPLPAVNVGWFVATMEACHLPKSKIARAMYYRLGFSERLRNIVTERRAWLHGPSMLAVYRKCAVKS